MTADGELEAGPVGRPLRGVPREDYVHAMLTRLYPPPLRVGPAGTGAPEHARFLLLPRPDRPRLLVPAGAPRPATRALRRHLLGSRLRTRTARAALTVAVGSGALDLLHRGKAVVSGPADAESIASVLARVLGVPEVLVAMPVGPPRATRKPVLQVCDPHGRALAYVKVGHDALTSALVTAEAGALERVRAAAPAALRAPRVLALLQWQGLDLLIQEPLPVPHAQLSGPAARAQLEAVVRDVARLGACDPVAWAASPYREVLREQMAACGPTAAGLLEQLAALDPVAPALGLGSWHGDLNPGNVALLRPASLVWDWERFGEDVPVGYDLLHYELQQRITQQEVPAREAAVQVLRAAPGLLAGFGVPPLAAATTARLYLMHLATRYLKDEQAKAGAALGLVEQWALPALREHRLPA